jgi:hypothetical protein
MPGAGRRESPTVFGSSLRHFAAVQPLAIAAPGVMPATVADLPRNFVKCDTSALSAGFCQSREREGERADFLRAAIYLAPSRYAREIEVMNESALDRRPVIVESRRRLAPTR